MRRFLFALLAACTLYLPVLAQSYDYEAHWKEIDSLDFNKLPQSALTQVQGLYAQALRDHQDDQFLKALFYRLRLSESLKVKGDYSDFRLLRHMTDTATGVRKALLSNALAHWYANFRKGHWNLPDKSAAADTAANPETWSRDQLQILQRNSFLLSITPASLLQHTPASAYPALVQKGNITWRPTLYDLLVQDVIDQYRGHRGSNLHAGAMQAALYADAGTFVNTSFPGEDTSAGNIDLLKLYQSLLRLHGQDTGRAALLQADLERLLYVRSIDGGSDSLGNVFYLQALQRMRHTYAGQPEVSALYYQEAAYYQQEKDMVRAKACCDSGIALWPGSFGAADCARLLASITKPELELHFEKVNVPALPFRTLVQYRNLDKIYLRAIRMGSREAASLVRADGSKAYVAALASLPSVRTWEQPLPNPGDYQEHSSEIKIAALPPGKYLLLASRQPDFSFAGNALAVGVTLVSNLAYIGDGTDYYFLDRQSGHPVAGVQVWVYNSDDDARPVQKLMTDATGHCPLAARVKNMQRVSLQGIYGKDTLFLDDVQYLPNLRQPATTEETQSPALHYFTDRSLYRPGQTVYFKGIVSRKNSQGYPTAWPGYKITVFLQNDSYDALDSLTLTSNKFGSISGKLKIPDNALPGEYNLGDDTTSDEVSFHVEAYKRPRFEVTMDTVRTEIRLGDSVFVTGHVRAFAGFNISDATVKYTVQRREGNYFQWYYDNGGTTVADTATVTDSLGNFTLRFKAEASGNGRQYFFTVHAAATDNNGETHDGESKLLIGHTYLQIMGNIPEMAAAEDLKKISLLSYNASGSFLPVKATLTLVQVHTPTTLKRHRLWDAPDQYAMSQSDFEKDFPLDEYQQNDDPKKWPLGNTVWTSPVMIRKDSLLSLPLGLMKPGVYELQVLAHDKSNAPVQQHWRFTYVSPRAALPYPAYLLAIQTRATQADSLHLAIGSTASDIYCFQTLMQQQGPEGETMSTHHFLRLQPGMNAVSIPRPGNSQLLVNMTFVKDNRLYHWEQRYLPAMQQYALPIQLEAHRNKLLPGEKEQWKINLPAGTAAELMASMYDASLDALYKQAWNLQDFRRETYFYHNWSTPGFEASAGYQVDTPDTTAYAKLIPDRLQRWDSKPESYNIRLRGMSTMAPAPISALQGSLHGLLFEASEKNKALAGDVVVAGLGAVQPGKDALLPLTVAPEPVIPRKYFNETAFFYPTLLPDKNGQVALSFTLPESLTRWKFMGLAHTPDLKMGYIEDEIVTQKPLMVMPNAPRFLREGDHITLSAKLTSTASQPLEGHARLELLDAATGQPVDSAFGNILPAPAFTLPPQGSTAVTFALQVPAHFTSVLRYRVTASDGHFSDGEENTIPVLSNNTLVTESLPLPVPGDGTFTFSLPGLLHSDTAATLQQQQLKLEFTANPAWNAVQALPFLMEYPYECAEQTFNRYYANALGGYIVSSMPRIRSVFQTWQNKDTSALLSNLEKNEDLKSALLAETPWVLDATSENARKQHVGLLFDLYKLGTEKLNAKQKLQAMQLPNGAFPWFNGSGEDRFITQYIVAGMGRLQQLQLSGTDDAGMRASCQKAIAYLDAQVLAKFDSLPGALDIHYLYARSFFKDQPLTYTMNAAFGRLLANVCAAWKQQSTYTKALLALALYRQGDSITARHILASLKEYAIKDKEQGTYWKDVIAGYYWNEAPIEVAAQLLEAFKEINHDTDMVNGISNWLLRNKQAQGWHTSKATADACFALLLQAGRLEHTPEINIQVGHEKVVAENAEAGTGYFTHTWKPAAIQPAMGQVTITAAHTQGQPAWGALYWQYFQDMNHVMAAKTTLQVQKQLYRTQNNTLVPITAAQPIKVGDKITIRITLTTERDLQYVHLKDLRAAAFEPVGALSGYTWQNGAGYYLAIQDVSMNFFFNSLSQGVHVIDYEVYATHPGVFSNGITTLQCMYAPEFAAHTAAQRITIQE
ncbi:A-macroglobulin complement component [Chitinophaga costaii]|uniref:A-macroglobulin complement component n=1 Tax=Chitinophaga costaii TaxID=1335309 RepID=A0A1C4F5R8_9BACT|nr:alpha-2-macroglobulin family protein [Chitinophaga costaii]PUZ22062.1 hypothetical protein DCM91_15150 [Chitinophaga costaii]SCC50851.1 A-macroglobulin complement component [Chitinophaga costaii]